MADPFPQGINRPGHSLIAGHVITDCLPFKAPYVYKRLGLSHNVSGNQEAHILDVQKMPPTSNRITLEGILVVVKQQAEKTCNIFANLLGLLITSRDKTLVGNLQAFM